MERQLKALGRRGGVDWSNQQIAANQARKGGALQGGEAFGVIAVAGAIAGALKPAIDFERAMDGGVGAVANASDEDLARLTATARELGGNNQLVSLGCGCRHAISVYGGL